MNKKNKSKGIPPRPALPKRAPVVEDGPVLSRRGKITIAIGVGVAVLGYYVLTLTDPAGRNWASSLCPFLILGGYALIGVGIVLPDRSSSPTSSLPTPKI